jgi:hypothetical protein
MEGGFALGQYLDIKIILVFVPLMPSSAANSFCRPLLAAALAIAVVSVAWWWHAGARTGFWQTQVAVEETDAVTGLTVKQWHDQFVPGVETPALGLAVGGALGALSFVLKSRKQN